MTTQPSSFNRRQPDSLADVLERVLDKGVVIAGDVVVNVLDIELLTLKLRLFIASADTAREMGMDWWMRDPFFSSHAPQEVENTDTPKLERKSERQLTGADRGGELERENQELRRQLAELQRPGAQQHVGGSERSGEDR
ncbi:MAG: gas vesicle protein [Pseudonocardiaceae bacterium]|nr:gas vesicle protein [Pseudonocardiaceae bacterium]